MRRHGCSPGYSAPAGRIEQARRHFAAIDDERHGIWGAFASTYLCVFGGDRDGTLRGVESPMIADIARIDDQFGWCIAQMLAHVGEGDRAMQWLRAGAERGFVNAQFIGEHDAMFATLRTRPDFAALLSFMGARAEDIAWRSGF